MSVETGTETRADVEREGTCSCCDGETDDGPAAVLTCYAEPGGHVPTHTDRDGALALCGSCADDVDELVETWNAVPLPPVDPGAPIASGYRVVSEDCSFCERALADDADARGDADDEADPLLGIEWTDPDAVDLHSLATADRTAYANYALCPNCTDVFDEFLRNVGVTAPAAD